MLTSDPKRSRVPPDSGDPFTALSRALYDTRSSHRVKKSTLLELRQQPMPDFWNFLFGTIFGPMRGMPRQHPLAARELEICRRLKEVRLLSKWPRSFLAHHLGVHKSVLVRLELGRMPLRYSLAAEILPLLRISPFWLATGQGERGPFYYLPSSEDLGIARKALFSEVFDTRLAPALTPKYASPIMQLMVDLRSPDQNSLRESLVRLIADRVAVWFDEIPDESLDAFQIEILKLGQKALQGFKKDRWEAIIQRRRHRRIVRERKQKRAVEEREAAAARLEEDENKPLTVTSLKRSVAPMIRTLDDLLLSLKSLTARPGGPAALAKAIKVPQARVSEWLSGKKKPGAENTFRLLQWVEESETKPQESPGDAPTQPGPKAQVHKSSYEKRTKVQKKG